MLMCGGYQLSLYWIDRYNRYTVVNWMFKNWSIHITSDQRVDFSQNGPEQLMKRYPFLYKIVERVDIQIFMLRCFRRKPVACRFVAQSWVLLSSCSRPCQDCESL